MEISLTEEQAFLIEQALEPALKSLLETGNYLPTVLVYEEENVKFYTLLPAPLETVRALAANTIREKHRQPLAYALLYDSTVTIDGSSMDALIVETGDAEEEEAHELARRYDRGTGHIEPSFDLVGTTNNLLHHGA